MAPDQLNAHQRDTVQKIFSHPSSGNIEWRSVRALLDSLGAADEQSNGKVKVTLGGETEVLVVPRGKDIDQQMIVDLRRMLSRAGHGSDSTHERPARGDRIATDGEELVRGKNVVAAIAYRSSLIYPTDALPGERPERVVAPDPLGRFQKVHHHAGNPNGTYEADNPEYWQELTEALAPAGAILVLGHGEGKANASHRWVDYVKEHAKPVAAKVVADIRVDLDHLDDEQVLRLAQEYFSA
jgi:hypothetical protein